MCGSPGSPNTAPLAQLQQHNAPSMNNAEQENPAIMSSFFPYPMDQGELDHLIAPIDFETESNKYSLPPPDNNFLASVHSRGRSPHVQGQHNPTTHALDDPSYRQFPSAAPGHSLPPSDQQGASGGYPSAGTSRPNHYSSPARRPNSLSQSNPRFNSADSNNRGHKSNNPTTKDINHLYPYPSNTSVDGTRGSEASFLDSQDFDAASTNPSEPDRVYRSEPIPEVHSGMPSYPDGSAQGYPSCSGSFVAPHGSNSYSIPPVSYGSALSQIDSGQQSQGHGDEEFIPPDEVRLSTTYSYLVIDMRTKNLKSIAPVPEQTQTMTMHFYKV